MMTTTGNHSHVETSMTLMAMINSFDSPTARARLDLFES
jgi:hypothetical protein